jgi:hypothetical protein
VMVTRDYALLIFLHFILIFCLCCHIFFSDMKVKLNGQLIPAHRFVLAARSEHWGVPSLVDVDFLGNMCIMLTLIILF